MGSGQSQLSTVSSSKTGDFMSVPLANARLKPPAKSDSIDEKYKHGKAFQLLEEYGRQNEEVEAKEALTKCKEDNGLLETLRINIGDRVAILGSQDDVTVYQYGGNNGMFTAILTAYNYHWALRTSPDDWWFCVIRRVAKAIDKNSKKESVRKFFVTHEGKKPLVVGVGTLNIHDIDYDWFFGEMSKQIDQNIQIPGYVDAITADFSTTSAALRVVSQITLMSSVQEFFEFKCITKCGIPVAEMLGTEEDWAQLITKLKCLRKQLEPINKDIGLTDKWWEVAEKVFTKLLGTYLGKPDKRWWSHIMCYKGSFGSGGEVGWEGWIVDFLEGPGSRKTDSAFTSGLVTVPLTFDSPPTGKTDTAALVAGMLGFTCHHDNPQRPSVRPFQGWSLLLPKDSPFR